MANMRRRPWRVSGWLSLPERMFGGVEARYTYRLRVNEGQARSLQQVFDACRFVWNTALGRSGAGVDGPKTLVPAGSEAT